MKIARLISVSLLTLLFFLAAAYASDQSQGVKNKRGGDIAHLLSSKELNLTAEQRSELKKIKDAFDEARARISAAARVKRGELEELFSRYDVSKEEIAAKVEELSSLNSQLLMKANTLRLQARKILTKEQFIKAKKIIDEKREREQE